MKVRQPLWELRVRSYELRISEELLKLIAEEVNVKNVVIASPDASVGVDSAKQSRDLPAGRQVATATSDGLAMTESGWITKSDGTLTVSLNTELTPELQKEGLLREITRQINDLRKTAGLTPSDKVDILIAMVDQPNQSPLPAGEGGVRGVIKDFQKQLRKSLIAKSVKIVPAPQQAEWSHELELDNKEKIWVGMSRQK